MILNAEQIVERKSWEWDQFERRHIYDLFDTIAYLQQRLAASETKLKLETRFRNGEYWVWQGDGEDHPESLSCPVVMQPEQVRELLSDKAAAVAAAYGAALNVLAEVNSQLIPETCPGDRGDFCDGVAQAVNIAGGRIGKLIPADAQAHLDPMIDDRCIGAAQGRLNYREPLGVPIPKPIAAPPQRELVYVNREQKGPELTASVQAPAPDGYQPAASVPPMSTNGHPATPERFAAASSEREAIFYRQANGEVVLSGRGIFPIKDTMKKIYGARGSKISESPKRYEWHMQPAKFQDFAAFCQQIGTPLVQERGAA